MTRALEGQTNTGATNLLLSEYPYAWCLIMRRS